MSVDREMWTHIVMNQLSNAVKLTAAGSITVTLAITADRVELRVTDTGRGIAARDIPLIFEGSHQLGTRADGRREGAGIGLSLVADLVHPHGGTIEVRARRVKGSTFIVCADPGSDTDRVTAAARTCCRRCRDIPVRGGTVGHRDGRGPARSGASRGRPPAARRLLLVEDNVDMRVHLTGKSN